MRLSDLQEKDIVSITSGKKLGRIIDAQISEDGNIIYFMIDEKKGLRGFISSNSDSTISFNQIKKIGTDVILVDI